VWDRKNFGFWIVNPGSNKASDFHFVFSFPPLRTSAVFLGAGKQTAENAEVRRGT